jgi:hypothetical protein
MAIMANITFIDKHGYAERHACEGCYFDISSNSDIFKSNPIVFSMEQLRMAGWDKLRELGGYICPSCVKKSHIRDRVKESTGLAWR